jgi:hypothetical protein
MTHLPPFLSSSGGPRKALRTGAFALLLAGILAGCGGSNDPVIQPDPVVTPTTPPAPTTPGTPPAPIADTAQPVIRCAP